MNILINASNLHAGGGVQVAASFVNELSLLIDRDGKYRGHYISIVISEKVKENLSINLLDSKFKNIHVFNLVGFNRPKDVNVLKVFNSFDVVFTVFGPLYFEPKCKYHIVGFAQAWIAYPNNLAYKRLSFLQMLRSRIKYRIQRYYFHKYDHLIVEQAHVKKALVNNLGFEPKNITVVNNTFSSVFNNKEFKPLPTNNVVKKYQKSLGFLGRPYSHKNLSILVEVNLILKQKYNESYDFVFSFTEEEMTFCGFDNQENFSTVGPLLTEECPSFYKFIDALIFPSLLECFSVTPLEALKMGVPVFASNLPFVSDVCGDFAFYFDPFDAENIADVIHFGFANEGIMNSNVKEGKKLVSSLPDAKQRAEKYLSVVCALNKD